MKFFKIQRILASVSQDTRKLIIPIPFGNGDKQIRYLDVGQQVRAALWLFDGPVCRRSVYTRANVVRKCDKVHTCPMRALPSSRTNLHGYLKLETKQETKLRSAPDYDRCLNFSRVSHTRYIEATFEFFYTEAESSKC